MILRKLSLLREHLGRVQRRRPSSEAFDMLAQHEVISPSHARELGGVVAVRNRIAHGYASVDIERLWAEIPAGVGILDRFAEAIARYVDHISP